MDLEDNDAKSLGDETPYIAQRPARNRHDEDSASYVKPIIKELVRTQVCFPNIKLLVDRISTVRVPSATESPGLEAYCMYLTDREKTIQAVVKRRLHKWLTTFDVREGSYVILKDYDLARGKRLHGEGEVFYLAIADFYTIGEEQRDDPHTDLEKVFVSAERGSSSPLERGSAKDENEGSKVEMIRTEPSLPGESPAEARHDNNSSKDSSPKTLPLMEPKKRRRRRGTASLDLDPNLLSLANGADKLRKTPSARMMEGQGRDAARPWSSDDHVSRASTSNTQFQREAPTQARASPEQLQSPLRLSTLASMTGANATRNKQVNILAMIDYVSSSTVKPTTAPLKRDVRIVDPSTDKKVTLSVFIDPVNFTPKEYDIILFRDLTTHDFSGGNLNAYPKKCRGKEWCILNPYDIKECNMESMELFRAQYRKKKAQEPK